MVLLVALLVVLMVVLLTSLLVILLVAQPAMSDPEGTVRDIIIIPPMEKSLMVPLRPSHGR